MVGAGILPKGMALANQLWVTRETNCLVSAHPVNADGTLGTVTTYGVSGTCATTDGQKDASPALGISAMTFNKPAVVCADGAVAFVIEAGAKVRRLGNNLLGNFEAQTLGNFIGTPTACTFEAGTNLNELLYATTTSATAFPSLVRTVATFLGTPVHTTLGTITVPGLDASTTNPFIQALARDPSNTGRLLGILTFSGKSSVIVAISKSNAAVTLLAGRVPAGTSYEDGDKATTMTDLRVIRGLARNPQSNEIFFTDASRNSIRAIGARFCNKLTVEDVTLVSPTPSIPSHRAIRNISMLVTSSAWVPPTGLSIPCMFSDKLAETNREQQMLQAGYRFGAVLLADIPIAPGATFTSARTGFIPCTAITVSFSGGGITYFPSCQQRARINCTLAANIDSGDWNAVAYTVPAVTTRVNISGQRPRYSYTSPTTAAGAIGGTVNMAAIQDTGDKVGSPSIPAFALTSVSITGYEMLDNSTGTSRALLTLQGTGFGPLMSNALEKPFVVVAGSNPCTIVSVSHTLITATCIPTSAFWRSTALNGYFMYLTYGVAFVASNTVTPPVRFYTSSGQNNHAKALPRWGERIVFASSMIGSNLQSIALVPTADAAARATAAGCRLCTNPAPCLYLETININTVACTLRLLHAAFVNTTFSVQLNFRAESTGWPAASPLVASSSILSLNSTGTALRILWQAPSAVQLPSTSELLQRAGGQPLTITLPFQRMQLFDFTTAFSTLPAGVTTSLIDSVTGWIGDAPCPLCGYASATSVVCTTPSHYVPYAKIVLSMVGSLNVTLDGLHPTSALIPPQTAGLPSADPDAVVQRVPYLSYEAPALVSIAPNVVLLPPTGSSTSPLRPANQASANITFAVDSPQLHLAVSRGDVSYFVVGFARPSSVRPQPDGRTVSLVDVPRRSIIGVRGTDGSAIAKVGFRWAGQSVSIASPGIRSVTRPSVYSTAPQRVSGGKTITIFGDNICPPVACTPSQVHLELSVIIGGALCTGLTGASSTFVSCTAPDLDQSSTPGFPFPAVTIVNAAGSVSVEPVTAAYPAVLAAAWSTQSRSLADNDDNGARVIPVAIAPPTFAGEEDPMPVLPAPLLEVYGQNGTATCTIRAVPTSSSSTCELLSAATLLTSLSSSNQSLVQDSAFSSPYGVALKPLSSASSSQQSTTRAIAVTGADIFQQVLIPYDPDGSAVALVRASRLGLAAGMGCAIELRASCTDALQERTSQTGPLIVQTPRLVGNWTASAYDAASSTQTFGLSPSADLVLSSTSAIMAWYPAWPPIVVFPNQTVDQAGTAAVAASASSHFGTVESSLLCNARLAPSALTPNFTALYGLAGVPVSQSLSVASGNVAAAATSSNTTAYAAVSAASLPPAAQAIFPSLSFSRAKFGAQLSVFAECSWLPSGEKLIFPPLPFRVLSAGVFFSSESFAPNSTAAVSVLPYQSVALPAAVSVLDALGNRVSAAAAPADIFEDASGSCSWAADPALPGSAPALHLSGSTASAVYTVQADGTLSPTPSITVEGASTDAPVEAYLKCSLWQREVLGARVRVSASPLRLAIVNGRGEELAVDESSPHLPRYFVPSDRASESPLAPAFNVSLFDGAGSRVRGISCELSATPSDVAVRTSASGSRFSVQATDQSSADGIVAFKRLVLVTPGFSTPVVRMLLTCTRVNAEDVVSFSWTITALPLAAAMCLPPAPVADAQAALPLWSIGIGLLPLDAVVLVNDTSAAEALSSASFGVDGSTAEKVAWPLLAPSLGSAASMAYSRWLCGIFGSTQRLASPSQGFPKGALALVSGLLDRGDVRCTVESAMPNSGGWSSSSAGKWYLTDATAIANSDGSANFASMSLAGPQNKTYSLKAVCRLGSTIDIAAPLPFSLHIRGCPRGSVPDGFLCRTCDSGQFSLGGDDLVCRACPKRGGAECAAGQISLLSGWWRAQSEQGQPIGPESALFPCPIPGACVLDASNLAAPVYSCSTGFAGPVCGHCNAPEYAFFGPVCDKCWSSGASAALLGVLLAFVASLVLLAAWQSGNDAAEKSDSGILLRLLLTYIQALGSLRAFKLGGGQVFKDMFSWSTAVTASPFSLGPVQCALQFSFLSRFVSVALLPLLAALAVIAAYLVISFVRACAASQRAKAGGSSPTSSSSRSIGHLWSVDLTTWWSQRKPFSIILSISSLAYMPIVGACIAALDCLPEPIDGVQYLRSDMSVACFRGSHSIARLLAIVLICVIGVGFPLVVIGTLWRADESSTRSPAFRSIWLPLYHGYRTTLKTPASPLTATSKPAASTIMRRRTEVGSSLRARCGLAPASLMFWEGTVLIRKLCIVLLATLVADGQAQTVGFQLLLLAAFLSHLYSRPFVRPLFNILEGLTLLVTLLTSILAALLLDGAVESDPSAPKGVAIFLVIMNALLIAVIAAFYARALLVSFCQSEAATKMAAKSKLVAKLTSGSSRVLNVRQLPDLPAPPADPALALKQAVISDAKHQGQPVRALPAFYGQNAHRNSLRSLFDAEVGSAKVHERAGKNRDDVWDSSDGAMNFKHEAGDGRFAAVVNPLASRTGPAVALGDGEPRPNITSKANNRKSFSAVKVSLGHTRSNKIDAVLSSLKTSSNGSYTTTS